MGMKTRITCGIILSLTVLGHWETRGAAVSSPGQPTAEAVSGGPPPMTVAAPAAADTDAVQRLMDDIQPLLEPTHWPFAESCLKRPDMAGLIRDDFPRLSAVWRRIARTATIGAGSTFLILGEDALAGVFCARPEAVADVVDITGRHAFHALALLRDPDLAAQFMAQSELFTRRLQRMVTAAVPNVREMLQSCQQPLLRPLLAAHPDEIVRLVECARETAPAALDALRQPPLLEAFRQNPSVTTDRLCTLPGLAGPLGANAWQLLHSPPLAEQLLTAPRQMAEQLQPLRRNTNGYAADICVALGTPALGEWLAADPDACLATLRELTDIAGLDSPELMSLLAQPVVSEALVADPPVFMERVRRLVRAAGLDVHMAFTALAAPEIASLLAHWPDETVALAEAVERAAGAAFDALRNPLLNESFRRDPAAVTDGLIRIRRVSDDHAAAAFEWLADTEPARRFLQDRRDFLYALTLLRQALGPRTGDVIRALDNIQLAAFFLDNPRPAVYRWQRIAHRAGDHAPVALEILTEPALAELFIADPGRLYDWVSRIVTGTGTGAGPALRYLTDKNGRGLWRHEPAVYLQLATVFGNMTPAAVELLASPHTAPLIRRVLAAEPTLATDVLYGLVFSLREAARDPRLAGNAAEITTLCERLSPAEIPVLPFGYLTDSVTAARTTAEKATMLKDMARICSELNLVNLQRYTPTLLENVYVTVTRPPRVDRRLALIMVSRNDPGEAFAEDKRTYGSLLEHGYDLIICESDSDRELAGRLRHGGVRGDSPLARIRRIDLLVIGGHGTADTINLGLGEGKRFHLDFSDFRWLRELPWPDLLAPDAVVLLFSCFTGADHDTAPRKYPSGEGAHDFANIMEMFTRLTGRTVLAPSLATGVGWLDFGPNGSVRQVHYWDLEAGNRSPVRR